MNIIGPAVIIIAILTIYLKYCLQNQQDDVLWERAGKDWRSFPNKYGGLDHVIVILTHLLVRGQIKS